MNIKCISNIINVNFQYLILRELTIDKSYKVLGEEDGEYIIEDDNGRLNTFSKELFVKTN